jgi:alginate O-acetyltransferase complex protein AlgI
LSFISISYLLFLGASALLYRLLPSRFRTHFLLLVSLCFVGLFSWSSLLVLIAFSLFNFQLGLRIKNSNPWIFFSAILANAAAILAFNYTSTFYNSGDDLQVIDIGRFLMVIGLSFYNLQHISYLVDVRSGRISPESRFMTFMLCTAWFPKVASGPLMLYQESKLQLDNVKASKEDVVTGVNRILWGFFKKMCIADRMAAGVASVYDFNDDLPGLTVLAGAIYFTVQLYFDFSGYTDVAIGSSMLFGIRLKENFYFPMRSTSLSVFWRRWHHSLMEFFRLYIFNPVAFRFRNNGRLAVILALAATFFVSAIWHGLGLTFTVWALCHFTYLSVEYYSRDIADAPRSLLRKLVSVALVWLLVAFGNIFFRSTSWDNCKFLLSQLFSRSFLPEGWLADLVAPLATGGHQIDQFNFTVTVSLALLVLFTERRLFSLFNSPRLRATSIFLVLLLIFLFGVFGNTGRFIYMQF